jgi:hypothetical protein
LARPIPIELNPGRAVEIDGALVARALGLDVEAFRKLMDDRRLTVLCERGTGEDEGLYRASFFHEGRRVRLVVDAEGRPRAPVETTPPKR